MPRAFSFGLSGFDVSIIQSVTIDTMIKNHLLVIIDGPQPAIMQSSHKQSFMC